MHSINDNESKTTETNCSKYLVLHGSYNTLTVATVFNGTVIFSTQRTDIKASKDLHTTLAMALEKTGWSLAELTGIIVDAGPGAFTSLRVLITAVNGISFALKTPLIGIDGLRALGLTTKLKNSDFDLILVLQNAYNNEIFYGVFKAPFLEEVCPSGYCPVELVKDRIGEINGERVIIVGNAVSLHKELLKSFFPNASFNDITIPSIESLMFLALNEKTKYPPQSEISPLYLKTQFFASPPKKA